MDEPIFKLPPVGWVGSRRVDAQYMMKIEARAKQLEDASKPAWQRRKKSQKEGAEKQLRLPGV